MQEKYEIRAALKTAAGYVEYCRFHIGADPSRAREIFHALAGRVPETPDACCVLRMSLVCRAKTWELMETRYCTLAELISNCHIITREVFKQLTLQ